MCLAALLAGCDTMPRNMDNGLKSFAGHNIRELVAKWGYPTSQREILGDTVYAWTVDQRRVLMWPTAEATSGTVDGVPYSGNTYGTQAIPIQFFCVVQIATDKDGVIRRWQWEGNHQGCSKFADSFDN